jgi:hypothetical protein
MRQTSTSWQMRAAGAAAGALALYACATVDSNGTAECDDPIGGFLCPSEGAAGLGGAAGGTSGVSGSGSGGAPEMGASGGGTGGIGGSGGLTCVAPKVDCGGTCKDLAIDPAHCGACNRACGEGTTCTQSACELTVMASGEVAPYALALSGTNVYWASPATRDNPLVASIRRVATASPGGAKGDVFTSGAAFRARSLAPSADGKFLFWGSLNDSVVYRGDVQLLFAQPIENEEGEVQYVAFADKVYWTAAGDDSVKGKDALANVGDPLALQLGSQFDPGWLAADGGDGARLYWVAGNGTRSLFRQKPGGAAGEIETFATGAPQSVEVHEGVVYWGDRAAGAIRAAATGTDVSATPTVGEARVGPPEAGGLEGFALDAGPPARLYWVRLDGASTPKALEVWRANAADGSEKLLLGRVAVKDPAYAGNPFGATYVRVDATHVYFADVGTVDVTNPLEPKSSASDGVVYRVAK